MERQRKKVSIEQIAKKAGVSKSTVSKALSNATDVSEITRDRILTYATEMGYLLKKTPPKHKKNVICFVYNIDYDNINKFAYDIILGFQSAAGEENHAVNVVNIKTEELENGKYVDNVTYGSCEGCFFIGFKPHPLFIEEAERATLPIVVLDDYCDSCCVAGISCDNALGYEMIIRHLAELGHRRIAFLGGEQNSTLTACREAAFLEAMRINNLRVYRKLVAYGSYLQRFDRSRIIDLIDNEATAIACASDAIATEVIRACQGVGLRVPNDISVTGFDGLPFTKNATPSITTVSQNRIQIGKCAFNLILQIRSGVRFTKLSLRPELCIRQSTGKCASE